MTSLHSPRFLRTILLIDAATCLVTGLLMTAGAGPVAALTQIPESLLFNAGASLFPVAAFIALVGTRDALPPLGVWLVIIGNIGWVAGSAWLLLGAGLDANALGHAFIAGQAAVVAILAELEYAGVRRLTRTA
jgi:hypothetical protein